VPEATIAPAQVVPSTDTEPAPPPAPAPAPAPAPETLVADELLVEDVSIDGMCGVY
jgi:mycofactocin precursor